MISIDKNVMTTELDERELSDSELAMISSGRPYFSLSGFALLAFASILLGTVAPTKNDDRPSYP